MMKFPQALQEIIESTEFEDGDTRLLAVEFNGSEITLLVELWDDFHDIPRQKWKFKCLNAQGYQFKPHNSIGLEIASDSIVSL
jgi:hypothetical protein